MTPDLKTDSSLGLTPLVTGIVEDAQTLISQQLSLFQSEIKEDLGRTKAAAIPLLGGVAVGLLAGFFLGTMIVRLLIYEWPNLPEYAANGIVGAVLAIIGGALIAYGITQLEKVGKHAEKAVTALKENVQWTTKK
jgi:uncharacterized membrane protein YraQ (UPF0718 family)